MGTAHVVLTGATGFLGGAIVRGLLARHPDARLSLLVRDDRRDTATARVNRLLHRLGIPPEDRDRIAAVPGDVARERCGLGALDYERLAGSATHVIHCAATVRFDEGVAAARLVNVEGTRHVLALARAGQQRGALQHFTYVGTAYVAGFRTGLVLEEELDAGQRFRNWYEQSKFEAERLVRESAGALPVTIVRPSIVAGDSCTGVTSSFKMLYWPLKIYARGLWRTVPGYPDAVIDVVPVDFVAAATLHVTFDPGAIGRTLHLCAGRRAQATIAEISERAAAFFGVKPPRYVNPTLFFALVRPLLVAALWGRKRRVLRDGHVYRSYFSMRMVFDTAAADAVLGPAGIQPPRVMEYLDRLLEYCRESDWGRRVPVASR